MLDHSHLTRRRSRQHRLSREMLIHLLILASVFAIGGLTAAGMLLWILYTASSSF